MKTSKRILNILFVAALILGLLPVGSGFAEGIPVVTEGYDPDADLKAGVRLENFGNASNKGVLKTGVTIGDLFGYSDGSVKPATLTWVKSPTVNHLTLSYEPNSSMLIFSVDSIDIEKNVGSLGDLNYIKLKIDKGTGNSTINLKNLEITPHEIIEPVTVSDEFQLSGKAGLKTWSITGISLSNGFTIKGDLELSGSQPGSDKNLVEIVAGYTEVPKISNVQVTTLAQLNEDPSLLNTDPLLLNAEVVVAADFETDTQFVMSENPYPLVDLYIASADFSLDGGAWQEMLAFDLDGFNENVEKAIGIFTAEPVGDHTACVHARDNLLNLSDDACQDFRVNYVFEGFFDPIDSTEGAVNVVKAGRTIPVVWRLTDANGDPISNEESFEGIFSSYPTICDNVTETTDLILEVAPGASDLQPRPDLGEGYWQYNWKTSKDYAGSCYMLFVEFDSGQAEGGVQFKFK